MALKIENLKEIIDNIKLGADAFHGSECGKVYQEAYSKLFPIYDANWIEFKSKELTDKDVRDLGIDEILRDFNGKLDAAAEKDEIYAGSIYDSINETTKNSINEFWTGEVITHRAKFGTLNGIAANLVIYPTREGADLELNDAEKKTMEPNGDKNCVDYHTATRKNEIKKQNTSPEVYDEIAKKYNLPGILSAEQKYRKTMHLFNRQMALGKVPDNFENQYREILLKNISDYKAEIEKSQNVPFEEKDLALTGGSRNYFDQIFHGANDRGFLSARDELTPNEKYLKAGLPLSGMDEFLAYNANVNSVGSFIDSIKKNTVGAESFVKAYDELQKSLDRLNNGVFDTEEKRREFYSDIIGKHDAMVTAYQECKGKVKGKENVTEAMANVGLSSFTGVENTINKYNTTLRPYLEKPGYATVKAHKDAGEKRYEAFKDEMKRIHDELKRRKDSLESTYKNRKREDNSVEYNAMKDALDEAVAATDLNNKNGYTPKEAIDKINELNLAAKAYRNKDNLFRGWSYGNGHTRLTNSRQIADFTDNCGIERLINYADEGMMMGKYQVIGDQIKERERDINNRGMKFNESYAPKPVPKNIVNDQPQNNIINEPVQNPAPKKEEKIEKAEPARKRAVSVTNMKDLQDKLAPKKEKDTVKKHSEIVEQKKVMENGNEVAKEGKRQRSNSFG
ncbi:hypothetical protein [Butyrivibrio sp. MB2005]|uniref:hypothetical protein n=1 Tax=Butyrivibrio sp. MB2005 TaxID=1280678 RepID=UPI0003F629D1|nr:hypothetical protein [Butyrivibrio sp. MB2005]